MQLETMYSEVRDQVEVRREGTLDELTVKVEPRTDVADHAQACDRAAVELAYRIKTFIGVTVSVLVCAPGAIERSIGKAKRVIDVRS